LGLSTITGHFEIYYWHRSSEKLSTESIPIVDFKVFQYDGKSQLIEYCHGSLFLSLLLPLYPWFNLQFFLVQFFGSFVVECIAHSVLEPKQTKKNHTCATIYLEVVDISN